MTQAIIALLTLLLVFAAYAIVRLYLTVRHLRVRYAPIIDVDGELDRAKQQLTEVNSQLNQLQADSEQRRAQLDQEYRQAQSTYEGLKRQNALLEENLEDISFGLYTPHYDFQTSEEYKAKLDTLRTQEKQLIHDGKAASCPSQWTVGGSAKEGARMVKLTEKLVLRAFNGECDAALANVAWNNITRMEERIRNSFETINHLVTVLNVSITEEFFTLKRDELRLAHEYQEKQNEEREEQRRIREQIREEEKVRHEIEKAREEADREAKRSQDALEKARAEAALASGEQLQKLNEHIKALEAELELARQKRERAVARAQLTRSGFVYVISNIGSFGEDVYKVGMTRRLEPLDRIHELSDAAVPFPFDVHAMINCDDAPALENSLHSHFNDRRINLANLRKEHFKVTLEELQEFAKSQGVAIEFTKVAEAKEYRKTIALRQPPASPRVEDPVEVSTGSVGGNITSP